MTHGSDEDEAHHHHVSISSLRSRFENLAHGHIHSPKSPPGGKSLGSTSAESVVTANGNSDAGRSTPPPQLKPVVPTTNDAQAARKPPPPVAAKPIHPSPTAVKPPALAAATSATAAPSAPPAPASRPAAYPPTLAPKPGSVVPAVSITPQSPPTTAAAMAAEEEEHVQSVKALRERFGSSSSSSTSTVPTSSGSRRASLEALRKGDFSPRTSPVVNQAFGAPSAAAVPDIPPLVAPKPVIPAKPVPVVAPKPVVAGNPCVKGPPPKPPTSRSASPALGATLAPSSSAAGPRPSSPLSGHRAPPPLPPVAKPKTAEVVAAPLVAEPESVETETAGPPPVPENRPPPVPGNRPLSAPMSAPAAAPARGPSPTPPPSRRPVAASASPPVKEAARVPPPLPPPERRPTMSTVDQTIPPPLPSPERRPTLSSSPESVPTPLPTGSGRPSTTAVPTPAFSPSEIPQAGARGRARVPPPPSDATVRPPPQRRPTLPSVATEPPPAPALPTTKKNVAAIAPPAGPAVSIMEATPTATAAPPLPVRRPSVLVDAAPDSSKPPLPGNKPPAPTLPGNKPAAPTGAAPPLPSRPWAISATNGDAPAAAPPRLPVRQATLNAPADNRARATSVSSGTSSHSHDDGYTPPPPPTRNVGAGASTSPAPIRRAATIRTSASSRTSGTPGDSDDEEDSAAVPTTNAQRLIDEHPDATQANRRPPTFLPDVRISISQSITSFAVHGRYACVAHHHVRVFDIESGTEHPILDIDQKDVGLELRVKEPRVTAMGFRPSKYADQEGRFLWCGNKDGHIWEIDIKTGNITSTKSAVHGSAVTHIMRHHQWMISVDEAGKLLVWGPSDQDSTTYKIVRTLRITEKVTFAKMIKGKLWTATAPAVRSTTNTAGARGPTVRVYDPCAEAPLAPLSALTTEWTGAATAATVMPLDPDLIYISHEGGFVSTWSTTDTELVCEQVLKISTTDILCLEGVGKRLWGGNRRGQIHVWNIKERPWVTTNTWTAHHDTPVDVLQIDPSAIDESGRFMLWSCARDSLHAWDGLLGVDWIEQQMVKRQEQYCNFRHVKVLVCTWNIDSTKPVELTGSVENSTFLEQVLHSVDSPDIIVFGFQEVVPLTDKKLTAKTLLFGSKGKDGGGATSDAVSSRYRAWAEKLVYAVRSYMPADTPYTKVHSDQLVGLFSCTFVKSSERESLRDLEMTTVKRGIGGMYGNKGAIVARAVFDDTSICFINVHLAAGQSHKNSRNADIAAILEDKAIFPPADRLPYVHGGDGTAILDHEMVILNGDLNYRIDQRREAVVSSVRAGDLDFLLEHDQLRKEMRLNHAFRLRSFAEPPITFAPTYKYDPGTNDYDTSEKRRVPAWCDRVLYLKTPRVQPINYQRYEITCSDHKPVTAGFAIQIKHVDPIRRRNVAREVSTDWSKREEDMLVSMQAAYAALHVVV